MSDAETQPEGAPESPEHGARLVVRLAPDHDVGARYGLALATAQASWQGTAVVREADGEVELGAWVPGAPPPWLAQAMHALLRSAWQRRRAGHPWPRRLARWRPSPEGSGGA